VRSSLGRIALTGAITLIVISVISLSTCPSWAQETWSQRLIPQRHHRISRSRSSEWRRTRAQTESAEGQRPAIPNNPIETLAHLHFPQMRWTDCENNLLEHIGTGDVAYCGPSQGAADGPPDDAGAKRMPFDVDAELIRWLCVDPSASKLVDPKGIQLHAARIVGQLDLSYVIVPFPLTIRNSRFVEDINIAYSKLLSFDLSGSQSRGITANNMTVQGDFILNHGFISEGEVNLRDANLTGDLDCEGGTFKNSGGIALGADGLKASAVFFDNGFNAEGEARLVEADLGGEFDSDSGTFTNPNGYALNADGLRATAILLRKAAAKGRVSLIGANGTANLECDGGLFQNPGGYALSADGIRAANVYFRNSFSAEGEVDFATSNVSGAFEWINAAPGHHDSVVLNLTHATVSSLFDDEGSWPRQGNLYLDGFVYSHFYEGSPQDASSRLRWLDLQGSRFTPQPYEQLAKVLLGNGDDSGVRTVLIAMENARREYGNLTWWERLWSLVLYETIRYGYNTWQALWFIGGFVIFGTCLFFFGSKFGAITQTDKEGTEHFRPFNSLIYSLETFLPLVDLQQAKHWAPKSEGSAFGRCLRWYLWIHILMGWFFTSMLIAGITGLVQKG
jgi:hypothetical protein